MNWSDERRNRAFAYAEHDRKTVAVRIDQAPAHGDPERKHSVGRLTFEAVEPGIYIDPTVRLMPEEAQKLIDSLWDAGLRPTQGAGSAGQLSATQFHLEDMRKLVFDFAVKAQSK